MATAISKPQNVKPTNKQQKEKNVSAKVDTEHFVKKKNKRKLGTTEQQGNVVCHSVIY